MPRSQLLTILALVVGTSLLAWGIANITTLRSIGQKPQAPKSSGVFSTQSATAVGAITQINGTNATVSTKDQTQIFPIAKDVTIYVIPENGNVVRATSDLKAIQLNKQASILFHIKSGAYEIASITFLPPPTKK